MPERALVVHIVGDTRSLDRAFKKSERSAQTFGRRMSGVLKGAALGGGLAVATSTAYGLAAALKTGFEEMQEGQKVAAQTNAVLKSTGKVAGVSRRQVDRLAGSLSRMSGVDDELIQSAENILLTFTKIGAKGGVFEDATRAALDLSTRFNVDLQSAAKQVGRALNDPIRGLSSLRRAGVSFSEQQEDQIKALVKAGETMKAQKIILSELQTEVGGAAKAAGDTLPGAMNKLSNTIRNTLGKVMERLAPRLQEMFERWGALLERWSSDPKNIKKVTDALELYVSVLIKITKWIPKLVSAFQAMQEFFRRSQIIIQRTALQIAYGFLKAIQILLDGLPDFIANKLGESKIDKSLEWLRKRIAEYNAEWEKLGQAGQTAAAKTTAAPLRTRTAAATAALAGTGAMYVANVNVSGVQNIDQLQEQIVKRAQQQPKRRRGAR